MGGAVAISSCRLSPKSLFVLFELAMIIFPSLQLENNTHRFSTKNI